VGPERGWISKGTGVYGLTEDGIDDMIRRLQGRWEIVDERNVEILQLFGKALRTRLALFEAQKLEACTGVGRVV